MSDKPLNQRGLTLVELLVVMTVGAMIAGAVVASMFQLFMV
ncbi:MAG: type II secretion system protein J, partial [Dehalococcoidia bacterium]